MKWQKYTRSSPTGLVLLTWFDLNGRNYQAGWIDCDRIGFMVMNPFDTKSVDYLISRDCYYIKIPEIENEID